MANATDPTVPDPSFSPLAGWEDVLTALAVPLTLALVVLVLVGTIAGVEGRSDWQGWLDARSSGDPEEDPGPAPAGP